MNASFEPYLSKARESLAGAQSELANGRYNNAANRAYYAAYNAAIVALLNSGFARPRWSHDEVEALFAGQLIARRKLYPAALRNVLPRIMQRRLLADYGRSSLSRSDAIRAVDAAAGLVQQLTTGV